MIITRRNLILAAPLFLVACVQSQQVDNSLASSLRVTEVTVGTSVERAETAVPKSDIVEKVRADVSNVLRRQNPSATRAVRLEVNVRQFYIANAAAGLLLGSTSSSLNADVKIIDVQTGDLVGEAFTVNGATEARPTMFGALAIKTPTEELAIISADLAANMKTAIFGE